MVITVIYPANLRRLAIIFFSLRAVTVKSLYTLQLSSGYNDLLTVRPESSYCSAMI